MEKITYKNNKIMLFNFIFTIGMVLYHIRISNNYDAVLINDAERYFFSYFGKFADHIGTVAMVYFFFVSGFLYYRTAFSRKDVFRKNISRIKTILLPYFCWTTIVALIYLLMGRLSIHDFNFFQVYFFDPVDGPLWYLLALFIFLIFSPLIVCLRNNEKLLTLLFAFAEIILFLKTAEILRPFLNTNSWWWYDNMFWYLTVYLLGAFVAIKWPNIIDYSFHKVSYKIIGLLMVIFSLVAWHIYEGKAMFLLYSVIIMAGLWIMIDFDKDTGNCKMFRSSFVIYSLHQPILIPIVSAITEKLLNGAVVSGIELIIIILFQVAIIVACSYIGCELCRKFSVMEKILSMLTGGRG